MIKLKDILAEVDADIDETIHIEYRTDCDEEEDILTGICHYKNGKIYSDDGDTYNLDDEFYAYEWVDYNDLIIWHNSEWIYGNC